MKTHLSVFILSAIIIASIGISPVFGQVANPVSVTTDKTSYLDGEKALVTGEVRELLTGYPISLRLIAPNGNVVTIEQIEIGPDNKYNAELTLGGPLMTMGGTYTIQVQQGTLTRTAQTTFTFPGSAPTSHGTSIKVSGTDLMVNYKITGGKLLSITPDVNAKSLIIAINATQDGSLTITLPRSVIDAKKGDNDDSFVVLVDGEEASVYDETETTSTDRTLHIEFPAGAEEIEIVGTFVIPEFGAIAAMILAVAIISIVAISARSRLSIIPRY